MTITIEISAEEEARLRAQARQQGQEVEMVARAFVRAGLDAAPTAEETEAARTAFVQRLLAQGIIPAVPEGRPGPPPRPVPVQGRPVSETLVEERR